MPQKLETVVKHVEEINNDVNRQLIHERGLIDKDINIWTKKQVLQDYLNWVEKIK